MLSKNASAAYCNEAAVRKSLEFCRSRALSVYTDVCFDGTCELVTSSSRFASSLLNAEVPSELNTHVPFNPTDFDDFISRLILPALQTIVLALAEAALIAQDYTVGNVGNFFIQ